MFLSYRILHEPQYVNIQFFPIIEKNNYNLLSLEIKILFKDLVIKLIIFIFS